MNSRGDKNDPLSTTLPEPRSPADLDERILRHARANAPRNNRASQRERSIAHWGKGLVAVSVATVAVIMTNPGEQAAPPAPAPPATIVLEEQLAPISPALVPAREYRVSVPLMIDAPISQNDTHAGLAADSTAYAVPRPAQKGRAAPPASLAYPAAGAEQISRMAAEASPAFNEESDSRKQSLMQAVSVCLKLRDSGKQQAALDCYTDLRRKCPSCALPETLEQVIEEPAAPDKQ